MRAGRQRRGREPAQEDTRARILAVALELFATRGYGGTSIRMIADQLGMTTATLYYHFTSKDDILESLCLPLVEAFRGRLDAAEAAAAERPRADFRRQLLSDVLDLMLDNQALACAFFDDLSFYAHPTVGPSVREAIDRYTRVVAGPDPTVRHLLRAKQSLAVLKSTIHLLPTDLPRDVVHRETLAGACALLEEPDATRG